MAASEGSVESFSSGFAPITVTIPERLAIQDSDRLDGVWISSNREVGAFVLSGTGSGVEDSLTLSDGVNEIAYSFQLAPPASDDSLDTLKTVCECGEWKKFLNRSCY